MENERVPRVPAAPFTQLGSALREEASGSHKRKQRSDGWLQGLLCGSRQCRAARLRPRCRSCTADAAVFIDDTLDLDRSRFPHMKSSIKLSAEEKDLSMFESFTVVMKRAPAGFGFDLDGAAPARISGVEPGSSAAVAGLQKGDFVVRYNGQNVARLSAKEIKTVLLRSTTQSRIILDIRRGGSSSSGNKENVAPDPAVFLRAPLLPEGPPMGLPSLQQQQQQQHPAMREASAGGGARPRSLSGSSSFLALRRRRSFAEATTLRSAQLSDDDYSYDYDTRDDSDPTKVREGEAESATTEKVSPCNLTPHQEAVQKLIKLEKHFAQRMSQCVQQYSRPLRHCVISQKQHQTLFQNIEKLAAVSEFHVRCLSEAPAVAAAHHGGAASTEPPEPAVGAVYLPRIRFLCDSHIKYLEGLDTARELLVELRGYPEFNMFLQSNEDGSADLNIDDFLGAPTCYLRCLHEHLRLVAAATPREHRDHAAVQRVVREMNSAIVRVHQMKHALPSKTSVCSSGSSGYSGSSGSVASSSTPSVLSAASALSDKPKFDTCSRTSDYSSCSGLSRHEEEEDSLDSAFLSALGPDETLARGGGGSRVADTSSLQRRLVFPPHLQKWKYVPRMKQLVYSGELMWKSPEAHWTTVYAVLFRDMMVVTRPGAAGQLDVVQEPLLLKRDVHLSVLSPHPSEFSVKAPVKEQSLELRAKTLEQKCVWRSVLELRLAAATATAMAKASRPRAAAAAPLSLRRRAIQSHFNSNRL